MALTGEQYVIRDATDEATIVEVGGGLRRYVSAKRDVTLAYREDELPPKGCGAVLVPWPNRLRGGRYSFNGTDYQLALTDPSAGNAIHGLGRWARWTCVRHDPAACTMALDIPPQTGWPFEVRVEVTYALVPGSGLVVTARAQNHGTGRAPFGAGFHPYIDVGDAGLAKVKLRVPAAQRLVVDDTQIPIGHRDVAGTQFDYRRGRRLRDHRLDDAFAELVTDPQGRAVVQVSAPGGGAEVWFDRAFQYVQVFTRELASPGRSAVAVEPMTCPGDAFNSGAGLIVLEPGSVWTGSWGVRPRP